MSLLETINSPADLKPLSLKELKQLAEELRAFMIKSVAETGGHLASSLGAVELTLALHQVFNLPEDRLIWDVGHQTYAHKILTGRRAQFGTLRQFRGISGFPKREESSYDVFNTGHSSTSISAALGMARARDLAQAKHKVVAVIGDGSLSNGLALEALNDAGHKKTDLLVILNDNRMSISKPVGGLANYLNRIITGQLYNRIKQQIDNLLAAIPAVGKTALKLANYLEEIAKGLIVPGILFEELGFRYLGPVNAHDLDQLLPTLQRVRELTGPILLHVLTVKGKGFEHAEKNPVAFHGTPVFNVRTGRSPDQPGITFSRVFARSLEYLARQNEKIVAIVAAMTSGTALDRFAEELPERFFDVGIAESHAVTLAAGMAAEGLRPVVVVYSTFLQRAYDEVLHDVCLQNLPVVFALDRCGLVGEDGPTHHGVFDIAFLRHIPNLAIFAPSDGNELALMLKTALARSGPTVIRYPRGVVNQEMCDMDKPGIPLGQARVMRPGEDVAILALGNMLWPALEAAESLARRGVQAAVIDPRSIKPLDTKTLARMARTAGALLTVEDHVLAGGFGSAVMEFLQSENMQHIKVESMGFPDRFIEHGEQTRLFQEYGLTAEGIEQRALNLLQLKAAGEKEKKKDREVNAK